jgi:hypothetical protein
MDDKYGCNIEGELESQLTWTVTLAIDVAVELITTYLPGR